MGTPTSKAENPIGDFCNLLFTADSPEFIYLSFGSVQTGDLWAPGDENPPNQTFRLTQNPIVACQWKFQDANWEIFFGAGVFDTLLWSIYRAQIDEWFWDIKPHGDFYYENDRVNPVNKHYHSGELVIGYFLEDEPGWVQTTMDNINITQSEDTFNENWPIDNVHVMASFRDGRDKTNILIKQEL